MSTLNIKQAIALGDKAILPALGPVKLEKVYEPRSDRAPWAAVLTDGESEIRAAFWERPELKSLEGQVVTLKSSVHNNRLTGLTVKIGKDQQGNDRWELSASKAVEILVSHGDAQSQPATSPQSAKANPPSAETAKPAPVLLTASAKPTKADVVSAFAQAYREAVALVPKQNDAGYLPAVQAAAATIYLSWKDAGLVAGASEAHQ